jgi:hypothetical protein
MKYSRADLEQAERQAVQAVTQVDTQVGDILRLRQTKQSTATAQAALEKMVALRDDVLERLKVMRRGAS